MDAKYWLGIFDEIGKEVYSEIKKIKKEDASKIIGNGAGGDKTTFIDDKIEKIAFEILKKTGKDLIFISEECGRKIVGKNPKVVITLDPLDGSDNFIHGISFYCISIALSNSDTLGSVEVAYIKNLCNGDTYTALKKVGVYKNGKKINAIKKDAKVILIEFTRSSVSKINEILENFKTRKIGCVCLSMCFVAEGVVDTCIVAGMKRSIDLAAAYLIVKEAGSVVTDFKNKKIDGKKIDFNTDMNLIISKNEEISSEILSLLGG